MSHPNKDAALHLLKEIINYSNAIQESATDQQLIDFTDRIDEIASKLRAVKTVIEMKN